MQSAISGVSGVACAALSAPWQLRVLLGVPLLDRRQVVERPHERSQLGAGKDALLGEAVEHLEWYV